jgi:hypothetical protein
MPGFFAVPIGDRDFSCLGEGGFGEPSTYEGPPYTEETARVHRYKLQVMQPIDPYAEGLLLYAYKCGRPAPEIDEITIHSGQSEIYRPGKNRWRPLEFTFYEVLDDECDIAARAMYNWHAQIMFNSPEYHHNPPRLYLKPVRLDMLDGTGQSYWIYEMLDCWPTKVTPSDLSYADTAIADVTVTMRFQHCFEYCTGSGNSDAPRRRLSRDYQDRYTGYGTGRSEHQPLRAYDVIPRMPTSSDQDLRDRAEQLLLRQGGLRSASPEAIDAVAASLGRLENQ